jgi:hypothetical protein
VTTRSVWMKKQQETGRKRDDCTNKVRLLVMQMVRKVLTFHVYNKLWLGANKARTMPPQCLGNEKHEFHWSQQLHHCLVVILKNTLFKLK